MNLEITDPYQKEFEAFKDSTLSKRLQKKFEIKPYYKRFEKLRLISVLASYFFNIVSLLTASTLIYFFAENITGNRIAAGAVTGAFLVLLEITKRQTAGEVFKTRLQFNQFPKGLTAVAVMLILMSISFSYFGAKKIVHEFTSAPTLLNIDRESEPILFQIEKIDNQIKDARSTKWRGTTTTKSQRAIERLTAAKLPLIAELTRIRSESDKKNNTTLSQHNETIFLSAQSFALITLVLEFIFLLCTYYVTYYDFRSLAEFTSNSRFKAVLDDSINDDINNQKEDKNTLNGAKTAFKQVLKDDMKDISENTEFSLNISTDPTTIEQALKTAKYRLTAAAGRLRDGIGKTETNERNIRKWNEEIERLKNMLQLDN